VQRSGHHPLRVGDEVSLHCTIPAFRCAGSRQTSPCALSCRRACGSIPAGTAGSRGFQSRSNASLHHTGCFCSGSGPDHCSVHGDTAATQVSCRAWESNPRDPATLACTTPQTLNTSLSHVATCSFPSPSTPVAFAHEFASVHQLANSPRKPAGHGAPAHFFKAMPTRLLAAPGLTLDLAARRPLLRLNCL